MLSIIQEAYGKLSEKEKQSIYWGTKLIWTELSKFIILLIIFIILEKPGEFIISTVMLMPIRCNMGGLHFKSYHACLIATFVFFSIAILLLPNIALSKPSVLLLIGICIILNNITGPVINPTRPQLSEFQIIGIKKRAARILVLYAVLYCTFPNNKFLICGIWIIVEQTLQLILSKLQRRYLK